MTVSPSNSIQSRVMNPVESSRVSESPAPKRQETTSEIVARMASSQPQHLGTLLDIYA